MRFSFKTGALSASALALSAIVGITPAGAQATRTWVSGTGDDVNPCSRTAPCKTFAGAISRTAAGGEINCIDPAGYGTVTITKSITLKCDYTLGSVLNSGTQGIVVAAGPSDNVIIDGIETNGAGTTLGTRGISFLTGGTLIVRNSFIYGAQTSPAFGISFTPSAASKLIVVNTTVANNGVGTTGGGILIQPTGGGSATISLSNVHVVNNANNGLRIDTTGNTGPGITVSVDSSEFNGNAQGIAVANPAATTTVGFMLTNSNVSGNSAVGMVVNGAGTTMRVGNTTISGNAAGVAALGGSTVSSYGDNRLDGNPTVGVANNGAFTGSVIPKK
jgi:hypothetical protein